MPRLGYRSWLGVALLLATAACAERGALEPEATGPQLNHIPGNPNDELSVCKTGPAGTYGDFTASIPAGATQSELLRSSFRINTTGTEVANAVCVVVWKGSSYTTVTITETPGPGTRLDQVVVNSTTIDPLSHTVSVPVGDGGGIVTFKNRTAPIPPASLGDRVWHDLNGNGIQDTDEPGIPGVTVRLFATCPASGDPIATATTGDNGLYLFTGLAAGSYTVQFVNPGAYTFSPDNAGDDDARDSDADPATGMTGCYTLAAGETNRTVDAGLYQPAVVTGGIVGCVYVDGFGTGGAGLGLRQAGQFGAFAINGGQLLLNSATVAGDVALGPGATTSGLLKTSITGTFYHHQAEPPSFSAKDFLVSGGFQRMDLTAAEADANARSAELAASPVPAGNALGNVTSSLTLTRGAGTHVFSVSSIDYKSSVLTLSGPADAVFVFNVAGTFKFAQSQVVLTGGVSAANVIFNVPSAGDIIEVHKAESVFNGTILAPHREVRYSDPGVFNGAIIAMIVKIYSGARLFHAPRCLAGVGLSLIDTSTGLSRTATTTTDGFGFTDMVVGRAYTLRLTSLPAGFTPHRAFAGSFGGSVASAATVSGITVPAAGGTGTGYDFAVRRN
jgi:hypothetical protein